MHFTIQRDGKTVEITATPEIREIKDPLGNNVKVPILGVVLSAGSDSLRKEHVSPIQAVGEAVRQSLFIAEQTGSFIVRLAKGREDKCQLGGPVKIATMAGQAAKRGVDWLIQLTAMLSMGIGLLNLLPIPPLDGGHLLLYGIEAVQRRPVSPKMQEIIFRIGGVLVLSFMLFVFFNDLFAC
jgi:regulator of sigma E protease